MRKRRDVKENNLLDNNIVKITRESDELFFEIRGEITTDVAEAVAIMMKIDIKGIWNTEIDNNKLIDPEKCLYWLSGGDKEWVLLENYNVSWVDCYLEFQKEFGFLVSEIVKRSKTLGDIKNEFDNHLNLLNLYDFSLSKGFIK